MRHTYGSFACSHLMNNYKFITTGVYPLAIANPPKVPAILKRPSELGIKQDNTD